MIATVWKNGKPYQRLSDGHHNSNVESLHVSSGDLYAGGYSANSDGFELPTVWKNGELLYTLGKIDGHVSLVFVK
jgi:hypothetical protein